MGSEFGGSWSGSGGYSYFSSNTEAFNAGLAYNEYHNSWASTTYGAVGEGGRKLAYHKINNDYFQIGPGGKMYVPYTDVSYSDYKNLATNAKPQSSWFDDHYYAEASADLSYGVQATLVPNPSGVEVLPYVRGGDLGISINLASYTLIEGKADTKNGVRITAKPSDFQFTQGIGVALGGHSVEYKRTVSQYGQAENVINYSTARGLIGIEYNFTTNQLQVGMMPSAKWAAFLGISGQIKQVLVFDDFF